MDRELATGVPNHGAEMDTMATTTKLYTAEDLWRMPTDEPWELWEGELRKVPGAGQEASELALVISLRIYPFVKANDLGVVTGADGTYILATDPEIVVVPDVGFVRWDRLPGRRRQRGYIPVPPDLAVEVRSPTDRHGDIDAKMARYRDAGVPLVWWVDPDRRTVIVFRNGQRVAELGEMDELDGEDVLPGFRLKVADIFA
jgi:Uma2 family endonuclease